MSRLWRSTTVLLLAIFGLSGLTPTAVAQKGGVRKPVKKKQQQEQPAPPPLPPYTPAPLEPLPLEQTPAVAPKVNFADGQLTIIAHNCVLADVLRAVRKQTGAEFDIPSSATERVVADIGPGPVRDVLTELLNGTHFNYVLVGSVTDPTAVESILLTPKTGGPDAPSPSASAAGMPQRGFAQRTLPPVANTQQPDAAAQGMDDSDTNDDSDQVDAQDEQQQVTPPNPATGTPDQQTPKTPEQLLQELQRQQQQQQQPQSGTPPQPIIPNQPPTQAPANKRD